MLHRRVCIHWQKYNLFSGLCEIDVCDLWLVKRMRLKIGRFFAFLTDLSRVLQACGQWMPSAVPVAVGRHWRYLNIFISSLRLSWSRGGNEGRAAPAEPEFTRSVHHETNCPETETRPVSK